ncbi:hypothetical protein F441_06308 [Phytophthora nicotianae CJ01A1]|uniref:Sensor domain-containing protein n=3 Tax=Phytophthora nicotianae TaxID=4792 RepID=W2XBR0_PHYNI|nr:hypothetical protein L915_06175 [Phytophthora nicotianae]ETO78754.1 hypothetical protein F444_06364 [Phytophthora nicotianae P1976]ETP19823.1 hypothetical protein F441_06308 [Phytophthora nicotianae CJ01A1]
MKSPHTDVIYHRYPSQNFDPNEKPVPVAIAVDDVDTDDESIFRQSYSPPLAPSPPGCCLLFWSRLGRLLVFHTLNAFLGLGGAILVLVLVPVSVGLLPLFGVGLVLFQLSAGVVEILARIDIGLANMVSMREPKLRKAFGIQGGLSTNNGCTSTCQRIFFLSPRMLLVMLYFATVKLVVGIMSVVAVAWGVVFPIEALTSNDHAEAIGLVNYHNHPGAYVIIVLGAWVLGALCITFVPKSSVALTTWACAERGELDEVGTPRTPRCASEAAIDLKAVVLQTPTPEEKAHE